MATVTVTPISGMRPPPRPQLSPTPSTAQLRLFQLISPALPVGAYAYSQGLEYAVHAKWVTKAADVEEWLQGILRHSVASLDVPVMKRLYYSWKRNGRQRVLHWSAFLLACRDTAELRAEERHLGGALARLLADLEVAEAVHWCDGGACADRASFAGMFALAAAHWRIPLEDAATGYVWSWLENQVTAAIKLVPLGQTEGQRLLGALADALPAWVEQGLALDDDDIGAAIPRVSMASALHEHQYTRLFRS